MTPGTDLGGCELATSERAETGFVDGDAVPWM